MRSVNIPSASGFGSIVADAHIVIGLYPGAEAMHHTLIWPAFVMAGISSNHSSGGTPAPRSLSANLSVMPSMPPFAATFVTMPWPTPS